MVQNGQAKNIKETGGRIPLGVAGDDVHLSDGFVARPPPASKVAELSKAAELSKVTELAKVAELSKAAELSKVPELSTLPASYVPYKLDSGSRFSSKESSTSNPADMSVGICLFTEQLFIRTGVPHLQE